MNFKTCLLSTLTVLTAGLANAQEGGGKMLPQLPDNIISVAPLQVTDEGVGIAASYERNLDKKQGLISFYMPVAVSLDKNNAYNTYYIMPGVKIYPSGNQGMVKYSVGPSLCFLSNKENVNTPITYDQWGFPTSYKNETINRFMMGMLINNTLNIDPSAHLHMALEFGLGFSYLSSYDPDPTKAFAQLGFQIGYRF
jgi:hypothetical protein